MTDEAKTAIDLICGMKVDPAVADDRERCDKPQLRFGHSQRPQAAAMAHRRAVRGRAFALAALLGASQLCACDRRDRTLREFEGAYPAEATPTGQLRRFTIDAAPALVPLLDGQPMAVWAYNGQVPGPTLRVRLGDTVRVHFTNHLSQPTTIHWHGVRLPNAMDGVPGVTQAAIMPGESFDYEFTPKDAGTFWFHPHLRASEQVERGLFGVLVVEDREPPPYSQDLLWVVDDWLLTPAGEISQAFNTRHDLAHDGRWGNVITVNGDRHAVMAVRAGDRIRLRLLNVANGRVFALDLGGLDAKVIAVDGLYTAHPLPPTGFELAPGNRLDLDITFSSAQRGQRISIVDRFGGAAHDLAEIMVSTADSIPPRAFASPARAHVPAWGGTAAIPPRADFRLDARTGGELGIEWTINGEAFKHGDHAGHGGGGMPHEIRRIPLGVFSKLRFVNDSFRIHPMHLHGQFFKVLTRNGVAVDEPYFRDTTLIHPKETVDVGVVPLDPGRWMMHCHILEHAEAGMMTLIDVE